jgi:hypothetical protein
MQMVILSNMPLTIVDGKGLKTMYSKTVATAKLKTYQTHSIM